MYLWGETLTKKTPAERRAEAQDRREKLAELVDGAGVIALLFGIPAASAGFLAVALPWWFA